MKIIQILLLLFASLFVYAELTCLPLAWKCVKKKIFHNEKREELKKNEAKLDSLNSLMYALGNWKTDRNFEEFEYCNNILKMRPVQIGVMRTTWMEVDKRKGQALNELVERKSCNLAELEKEIQGTCQKLKPKKGKSYPICERVSKEAKPEKVAQKSPVHSNKKGKFSPMLATIKEGDDEQNEQQTTQRE